VLESEASLLQNRLEGLMYAWKRCQIQLYRVEVDVYWLIDQNVCLYKIWIKLNFRPQFQLILQVWERKYSDEKFNLK
jgi:hypothetical protein